MFQSVTRRLDLPRQHAWHDIESLCADPQPEAAKRAQVRQRVDSYLGHKTERQVLSHSDKLLGAALARSSGPMRHLVVGEALFPAAEQASPALRKAEQVVHNMGLRQFLPDLVVGTFEGMLRGLGYGHADPTPLRREVDAILAEGYVVESTALAYARGLSPGALDEALAYSETRACRIMMHRLPQAVQQIMADALRNGDSLQPAATPEEQRKCDKLAEVLRASTSSIDARKCRKVGISVPGLLAEIARHFEEADLDAILTWHRRPSARQFRAVDARQQRNGYLSRPDVQRRLKRAVDEVMRAAEADPLGGLLGGLVGLGAPVNR
jgi:hypothetical protein